MRLFNKVAVIGTGLVGGSLALAIKKHKLCQEVVGVTKHRASLKAALRSKAIDQGSVSLDIIKGADLLILAMPVDSIIALRNRVLEVAGPRCIVTDVGSTKDKIVSLLEKTFPNYVGAHPLAGSEKRGILNARTDIFKDSLCILTPTGKTPKEALAKIEKLWKGVGAKTVFLSPQAHDRILSFTSHLPHIIAFSLINSVPKPYLKFSSGSLKDTTRIASSDPLLWQNIFLTNRANSLKALDLFVKDLTKIKGAIRGNNKKLLLNILIKAQKKRNILG
jgi:cyclohexadieny/prephenate dehydrogenase / 3-phosphoshikimate 1-carboxyvinyltransferase